MKKFKIYLGNKNTSSWSLRAWLMLKQTGVDFEEIIILLDQKDTQEKIAKISPAGKVPVLQDGNLFIWDSLAIGEYLHEMFPTCGLWPNNLTQRAIARSISAEMHSSFFALRSELPMRLDSHFNNHAFSKKAEADIQRIFQIWDQCQENNQTQQRKFLFGDFSIADAMFAPVVTRFLTYKIPLSGIHAEYANSIMSWPAMKTWYVDSQVDGK